MSSFSSFSSAIPQLPTYNETSHNYNNATIPPVICFYGEASSGKSSLLFELTGSVPGPVSCGGNQGVGVHQNLTRHFLNGASTEVLIAERRLHRRSDGSISSSPFTEASGEHWEAHIDSRSTHSSDSFGSLTSMSSDSSSLESVKRGKAKRGKKISLRGIVSLGCTSNSMSAYVKDSQSFIPSGDDSRSDLLHRSDSFSEILPTKRIENNACLHVFLLNVHLPHKSSICEQIEIIRDYIVMKQLQKEKVLLIFSKSDLPRGRVSVDREVQRHLMPLVLDSLAVSSVTYEGLTELEQIIELCCKADSIQHDAMRHAASKRNLGRGLTMLKNKLLLKSRKQGQAMLI